LLFTPVVPWVSVVVVGVVVVVVGGCAAAVHSSYDVANGSFHDVLLQNRTEQAPDQHEQSGYI
jgi:hypothetical protein